MMKEELWSYLLQQKFEIYMLYSLALTQEAQFVVYS